MWNFARGIQRSWHRAKEILKSDVARLYRKKKHTLISRPSYDKRKCKNWEFEYYSYCAKSKFEGLETLKSKRKAKSKPKKAGCIIFYVKFTSGDDKTST